jgi:hypothetical protein
MHDPKQPVKSRITAKSNILLSIMTIILFTCWLLLTNLVHSDVPLDTISDKVDFILRTTPLTDTHNDFPIKLLYNFKNKVSYQDLGSLPQAPGFAGFDTDLGRLKKVCACPHINMKGRAGAIFWSAFVPCTDFKLVNDNVKDTVVMIGTHSSLIP